MRTTALALLVLICAFFALAPAADAATSRKAAAEKALAALGTEESDNAVIVFGLRRTIRPRSVISQAGPDGGAVAASVLRSTFHRARNKRIRKAGAQMRRADVLLRTGAERSWFFFEDQGPHQAFEHPGRVVVVGARTGNVRVSDVTRWVPLIDGKAPAFFQSAKNYESPAYRVFSRPWASDGARSRASTRQAGPSEPRQQVADALAAEKSCAFRISDTLGDFFDFGRVDQTRARLGNFFEGLEKLNAGFVSRRYTTKSGRSPIEEIQALINEAGCLDLFLYTAGAAPKNGEAGIVIGMRPSPGGLLEWHVLSADDLEALVKANSSVTFKFLFDVPYSSRINEKVIDEPNTVLLISSGGPGDASFTFLPEVLGPDGVQGNAGNPDQLLEFTNAILTGLEAFVRNPEEVAQWLNGRALGGPSMMSWMMARAMYLSPAWIFAAPMNMIKLPVAPIPPAPPSLQGAQGQGQGQDQAQGQAPNRAPRGTTPAQPTNEDTAKPITLTATDADDDPLTFTITDFPDHGDLTGTPPNLVYTPDQDFDGDDEFTYQVSDGRGGTDTQTVQIPITPDNDAAAVTTTSSGCVAFTEDGAAVAIDPGLTISDPDSTQLEGATVSIVGGTFQAGDELVFVDQNGITGTYNSGTGVLTLTGTASVSDYQAALRSVEFDSTQQNPTTSRTIEFRAEDGDEAGVPATRCVTITPVNDAPVATASAGTTAVTEDAAPVAVDPSLTASDVDDANLESAQVRISSGLQSGDTLGFTDTASITGTYNSGTGVLTLTGTDSVANYQAALRSVTFATTNDNPTPTKDVEFIVNDGSVDSAATTKSLSVSGANDAPVVTTTAGSTAYSEGDAGTAIDSGLTVSDIDDTNLASAVVRISSNFESGDDLVFVNQNGISGVYNTGTGVLTLTGTASVSDYQAALRSVEFRNVSDDDMASPKTVEFKVNDGGSDSNLATKNVSVTGVNDNPTLTTSASALPYTEGDGAEAVDPGITVTDPDSANLAGATIQITGNHVQAEDDLAFVDTATITGSYNDATGTLTLSGSDTLANYQAALRSVTYENGSDQPSTADRTVSFQVDDGGAVDNLSNVATRDITITRTNDAPVVNTSAGATAYSEGDPTTTVDGALTVSDVDDANLESATVSITSSFESGDELVFVDQSGITGNYNSGTGVLTLTGTASVSDYQTALRSVGYRHTGSDNPNPGKVVEFKVHDGDLESAPATKSINVTGVNDNPAVTTTASALSYSEGDGAVAADTGLTVTDPDSATLAGATVQITANFVSADDELAFTDQNGISGAYNDSTGTLTLSGTASLSDYQTALRSVTYENISDNPSGTKTVSFQVDDGGAANNLSNTATRDINLSGVNDAPVVTTSGGSTSYTEGDPATAVDGSLTVTDADDTNLESGQVRISSGFQSGDDLVFVDQNGISGVYNTGTGVLTLTGTASVSDYQTALRSVEFRHTGDNPSASKTVEFKVNDGDLDSAAATKTIAITPVNDAPTLTTTASALSYTEGDGAVAIDTGLTTSDPDSTQFQGATVQITSNFSSANDELAFTNQNGISGAYNDSTGTLTLSGNASLADYQTALRSVTYESVDDNPSGSKTVSFQATDAEGAASNVATRDINFTAANDAPVVTTSGGSTSYTEGDPATAVDGSLTVTDADDTNLEGGQVRVSANFQSGDDLVFVDQNGISGVYNSGTGVLTLTGTSSVANYQTALRSIQFQHTTDNPSASKTVEFKVNDGDMDSNAATKTIAITPVNDASTVDTTNAALAYTEGDGAVAVDSGFTVTDPDSTQLQGATVQITANFVSADDELAFTNQNGISGAYNDSTGTLTLSGNASLADYQTAIRSVTYESSSDDPSATKTVSFQVTDAEGAASNVDTRDITFTGVNDAPVVTTSAGATSYTEGDPATAVDGSLTVTDADDTNLESGQVRISANFQSGDDLVFVDQNGITGNYNSGTGVLTLTGTSSVANYQTALRSIQYQTTNDNPNSPKTVEFKVNDGDVDSNAATKNINITGANDAPTMTTSAGDTAFVEDAGAVVIDNALTLTDPDSTQIQGATVSITTNFDNTEDQLEFTNQNGISGLYNSSTGVLTLSGNASVADYQTALRSVEYDNTDASAPSPGTRTISFQATDAEGAASNVATKNVTITGANDAPVVTTSAGDTSYTEGDPATAIDGSLTVTDADDTNLEGGQVRISANFQSGDELEFVDQNGITGNYNTGTGVLTLSGTSSVANYETALRSIEFRTSSDNPSSSKTVEFKVNDGDVDSNLATKNLAITPVNDAPTVTTSAGTTAFVEDTSGPVAVDNALTVTDPDSANLSGATVSITTNFDSSEDELEFTNQNGITGNYNSGTGVLTLSGSASVADYQTALRSVDYDNTDTVAPSTATRTVSFQVTDSSAAASNVATKDVSVASVNDAPVVTTSAGDTPYTEDDPATTIDGSVTVTDQDDTNLEGGQVRISTGFQTGDELVFTNQNGITGNYNSGTGVLTLSGTSSVANYQTALQSVQFQSTNQQPVNKTVEFKVNDGDVDSNLATKNIAVTATNDAPIVTAGGTLSYTENDPATAVHTGLTIDDTENDQLSGGSASITANYQAGQDFLNWTDNDLGDNITLDNINSSQQTIVLTGLDGEAEYQAALRAVTYQNGSENPSTLNRTVTFSVTDQPGLTGSDTRTISITAVDDPPTANNDSATVLEDAAATSIPVLTNDTDPDGGQKTISNATDPANGTVVLTGGSPGAHTGLTYQPDPNYCNDPPGTTPDTFNYTVNGGSSAQVSMTVTCVNDAPVADDETFNGNDSAHGNTTLQVDDPSDDKSAPTNPHTEITGDILAGDTDIDSPLSGLTVTPGTFATNDGGSVTLEADGDFVFQPAPSTSCTDTSDFFDYTVEDNGSPEQTDTGRVTIAIAGCVWYVHNNSPGNSGTSNAPFDTLAQAETASGTNHTVFVFDGDNTPTGYDAGGYAMNSGERLIGEHEGLVVDPDQGGGLTADTLHPANAGAHPTLTSTGAGLDVIDLDDGNEIRGFNVDPQTGHGGIQGSAGDTGGATIDDVNIVDTFGTNGTQAGLELNGTTGTFNISNFTVDNNATGVLLNSAGTVDFAGDSGVVTLDSTGGPALSATSTNMGTSNFDDIIVSSSTTGGVILSSASGTTNLGDGSGTDLNLTTSSGPTPALSVQNSGTVTVGSGGTDELHATGGPALDVTGTSGASFDFEDVDSTNSANDGINIDGLGTGIFQAAAGDIGGAAGISFDLNGGSGTILYQGNLNNGGGTTAIDITGRSGGGVTLSGPISDTNDAGGALNLSSNTGGSTTLSNGTKQFNTGATDAVSFTNSDGHTLNLTGNGLDIDTTSGNGLVATTAGTLQVAGTGNTINSTALGASNRGINVSDTDFAATDATFQSVSTSGGTNGIRLNNTGTAGNLAITGTGANDSGGTISNTSGNGIELQSTDNFTADEMNIQNPATDGVGVPNLVAGNVTHFTFTDSTINNAGQSDASTLDSAFGFNTQASANENNIDGNVTITGNTITSPYGSGVAIFNHNGTITDLNLSSNNMTSGTIVAPGPGGADNDSAGDAIQVVTFGGTGFAANLTKATVSNNNITGFPDGSGIEFLGGSQGTTTGVMGTPGSSTDRVVISGNDVDGHSTANPTLTSMITFDVEGRARGHAVISNNGTVGDPMTNVAGNPIAVGGAGDGDGTAGPGDGALGVDLELHVTGNVLVPNDTPLSAGASGIGLGTDKDTIADATELSDFDVNAEIANNNVSQSDGTPIRILHRDQFGHLNLKLTGNTAGPSATNGNGAIRVENGSSGNATYGSTMCADIANNTTTASGPDGFGDVRPGITLVDRDTTDSQYQFGIVGLSPSPATGPQTETFVAGNNPNSNLGTGFWAGKRVAADNGNNWHSCTLPAF